MKNPVVLLIIYNHRYDKNIDKLEAIYKEKFKHIFHIIPFYDGKKENVLPVYESSYQFSGYIAQAKAQLDCKGLKYEHYFFVADDMILNPNISENTYREIFKTDRHTNFITEILEFTHTNFYLWHGKEALMYSPEGKGAEISNIIPSAEEGIRLLNEYGVNCDNWKWYHFIPPLRIGIRPIFRLTKIWLSILLKRGNLKLTYPMVGAFSDIAIISEDIIDKFSLYCGAFAASRLFVEYAFPTSLIFSTTNIVTAKDLDYKAGALWGKQKTILEKYENKLDRLLKDYPSDYLFLHPIKLSQWQNN